MGALRVTMLGLRGFPNVQGGVEKHVEQLACELSALGCDVEAIVRSRYLKDYPTNSFRGVQLRRLWSPKSASFEAIVHSVLGLLVAAKSRPDILHIHAIGPALVAPLARLLGLRVVVTHHGHDYRRQKWGMAAKMFLHVGEMCCAKFAHARIAVSHAIARVLEERFSADATVIPNGMTPIAKADSEEALRKFGLSSGRYVLMVGRIVPEKRHLDALQAFRMAALDGWKLVIVGEGDFGTDYVRRIEEAAAATPLVVRTGFQTGTALAELYSHAGMFILPSSHEGLPIVLLEALSFGIPVIASDIDANVELGLPLESYFPAGNIEALAGRIASVATELRDEQDPMPAAASVPERFDWRHIAKQTLEVYAFVARERRTRLRYAHPLVSFLVCFLMLFSAAGAQPAWSDSRFVSVLHRGVAIHYPQRWAGMEPAPSTTYVPEPLSDDGYVDPAILKTIREAGFDFIRLTVDPGPFLQFGGTDRDALDATLAERVRKILGQGLSVIVDFHPDYRNSAYAPSQLVGAASENMQPAYARMLSRTARLLASLGSRRVLLELMNEPATDETAAGFAAWQEQVELYYRAARAAAPRLGLILAGGYWSQPVGLLALRTRAFESDPNVMFTFHHYFPLEFTAQGSPTQRFALYLADVPYPAQSHPLSETIAATLTRIADSDLSAADKAREAVRTSQILYAYWASDFDRRTIAADFDRIGNWAHAHRIADNRILLGEFGVTRTYGPYRSAADADRGRWLRDVREEAEAHHFPWSIWVYWGTGGMQITQEGSTNTIDPVVCRALGLRTCPSGN